MNEDDHEETSMMMDEDDDKNMEGDESTIKSINEFHNIDDEVNEMITDERYEEVITVTSNSISEDERSDGGMSNNVEPKMNIIPETVLSTTWTEGDRVHDNHSHDDDSMTSQQVKDEADETNFPSTTETDEFDDQQQEGEVNDAIDQSDDDKDNASNTVQQRYNLRSRKSTDYKNLHRYGEAQLLQLQKKWVKEQKGLKGSNKIRVKYNDLHRRIINTTFTQISKEAKYAQVSVSEGIKRHGEKVVMAVLSEYAQ